jgi:hypothetical protein
MPKWHVYCSFVDLADIAKKTIKACSERIMHSIPRKTQAMKLTERQKLLLESACDWIQENYPEADLVGFAWWFLDCGCMAGIGFSRESGLVTPAVRIDRQLIEDRAVPECEKCSEQNPTNLDRSYLWNNLV